MLLGRAATWRREASESLPGHGVAEGSATRRRGYFSVNVSFAPKVTEVLRCRKASLCASSRLMRRSKHRGQLFSSRFNSLKKRQSVPSAMILLGVDLIMPASCNRSA